MQLREALIERQKELGLSDSRFAALLGVSRSTWTRTRLGGIPVGRVVALGAKRAFPELREQAVALLCAEEVP